MVITYIYYIKKKFDLYLKLKIAYKFKAKLWKTNINILKKYL